MFLKRSERASCGGSGTRGMFRSDEYEGGADWEGGGCGVPKSLGAGDADRECTERDVSSFMRFVLSTWRKRSVRSAASWLASWLALRLLLLLWPGSEAPCECSMARCSVVAAVAATVRRSTEWFLWWWRVSLVLVFCCAEWRDGGVIVGSLLVVG